MDNQPERRAASKGEYGTERRKHPRHKYIERVIIQKEDGTWTATMSFEISVGGISLATAQDFAVGQHVELWPVVGVKVKAIVRRKKGSMYGFEFIELDPQIKADLENLCRELPLFQSMADV
jgi:c-di-GMP-binding flagellar brake protein YcgR